MTGPGSWSVGSSPARQERYIPDDIIIRGEHRSNICFIKALENQRAKKVLIFGGSFNPPTLAHIAIIAACLALPQFDQVWLMPSRTRRDKRIPVADDHRLAMLKLVKETSFTNDPRLHVADIELQLPAPTELYRTVQALHKTYPGVDFWFVYGMDSYLDMPHWVRGRELMQMLKVVVFSRPQGTQAPSTNASYIEVPARYSEVSSTAARQAIAQGKSVEHLVSRPVATYAQLHRLYSISS